MLKSFGLKLAQRILIIELICLYLLSCSESADKVVLHTGKYEELIVCSHEIAASTAQLVAASKVKGKKNA